MYMVWEGQSFFTPDGALPDRLVSSVTRLSFNVDKSLLQLVISEVACIELQLDRKISKNAIFICFMIALKHYYIWIIYNLIIRDTLEVNSRK